MKKYTYVLEFQEGVDFEQYSLYSINKFSQLSTIVRLLMKKGLLQQGVTYAAVHGMVRNYKDGFETEEFKVYRTPKN